MYLKTVAKEDAFRIFQNERQKTIENSKNGIPHPDCSGCIYLKEYDLDDENISDEILEKINQPPLINYIVINHFKHCDCNCTYCSQGIFLKKVSASQKSDYYDLLPTIKDFYRENLIDNKNLTVEFQGGSIAMLDEFEDLTDTFLEHDVDKIMFYTNGLKYMPSIVKTSHQTNCMVVCSVDAGTPETFKKLKPAGDFDTVIENLTTYSKYCLKENPNKEKHTDINAKYILIQGVNDSLDEVEGFLNAVAKAGVNMTQLDMDFRKVMMHKGEHYDIPKHYYELFDFFRDKTAELGLYGFIWEYIENILAKGYFE